MCTKYVDDARAFEADDCEKDVRLRGKDACVMCLLAEQR